MLQNISSVLGLNIGLTFISWARIDTLDNKITHLDFKTLPENINKMEQCDIYTKVIMTVQKKFFLLEYVYFTLHSV